MPLLKSEKKKSPSSGSVCWSIIDDGVSRDNPCVGVNDAAGRPTSPPVGVEFGIGCFRVDVVASAAACDEFETPPDDDVYGTPSLEYWLWFWLSSLWLAP